MNNVLEVRNLTVGFETEQGRVTAVDDVSFEIRPGEVLGLVGESGCGKSVTALSILRLLPHPPAVISSGSILFGGYDLLGLPVRGLRDVRGRRISMIFQEPMTALSPLMPIGRQMAETRQLHAGGPAELAIRTGRQNAVLESDLDLRAFCAGWLERVGIPDPAACIDRFPHELSGGMRQRVMIAMALMLDPDVIIADEPTTALDVTVQAQVFDLLLSAKSSRAAVLFITHDMGAVWEICDRVMVMYAARIVERGAVEEVFRHPAHPYTRGLLRSMPSLHQKGSRFESIPGQVPAPGIWPRGCRFSDRCPFVIPKCREVEPLLREVDAETGRLAACHRADEVVKS